MVNRAMQSTLATRINFNSNSQWAPMHTCAKSHDVYFIQHYSIFKDEKSKADFTYIN